MAVKSLREAIRIALNDNDVLRVAHYRMIAETRLEPHIEAFKAGNLTIFQLVDAYDAVMQMTVGI